MSAAVSGSGHQTTCPHCQQAGELFAPMLSARPGAFTLRCLLDSCNRMRGFHYLDGHVDLEIVSRAVPYYQPLKLHHGYLEVVAGLVQDAVDLHLIGQMNTDAAAMDAAYRGAAVHLRVAAQLLVAGYVLRLGESELRDFSLGPLIGKLRKGFGRSRIKKGRRPEVLSSLDYILRLGDTAAHQFLKDPDREVPPTRGNIEIGFDKFDNVVDAVRLP